MDEVAEHWGMDPKAGRDIGLLQSAFGDGIRDVGPPGGTA